MKRSISKLFYSLTVFAMVAATPAFAAGKFVAANGRQLKTSGKVIIANDSKSISAFLFDGDIRTALVTLRSSRVRSSRVRSTYVGKIFFSPTARVDSDVPQYLSALIYEASEKHGIDPRLVAAVAHRESRFNPFATSPVGAQGVMQLMPSTARYLGVSDSYDARENVFAGTRYLKTLLDTFDGDLNLTLAAYNAGPGAVRKYRGIPPYRETRAYVAAVRNTYEASLRN